MQIEVIFNSILKEQTNIETKKGKMKKVEFLTSTGGEYPAMICFSSWNDKADFIKTLSDGDKIKVNFKIQSRIYNERAYTDLTATQIDIVSKAFQEATDESYVIDNELNLHHIDMDKEIEKDDLPF